MRRVRNVDLRQGRHLPAGPDTWKRRFIVFLKRSGALYLVLKDDMIVSLVYDFVLADLRLAWDAVRHGRQLEAHLVGVARLQRNAIVVRLRPRILIKRIIRLFNIRPVQERHINIDVRSIIQVRYEIGGFT